VTPQKKRLLGAPCKEETPKRPLIKRLPGTPCKEKLQKALKSLY